MRNFSTLTVLALFSFACGGELGISGEAGEPGEPDGSTANAGGSATTSTGGDGDGGAGASTVGDDGGGPAVGGGLPGPEGVVFETNFVNDGDYYRSGGGLWDYDDVPTGWDGVRTNQGTIRGVSGEGVAGSVAMKFEWPSGSTALATSLGKHLTGDATTGYPEVFVRYQVRLPNGFRAGLDGKALPYWKWGRLWQNTGVSSGWTENRTNSYYIVWNWGSGLPKWGIKNNLTFGENLMTNNKGSAGGPRTGTSWYVSGSDVPGYHTGFDGHWDHVGGGDWEFDHTTRDLLDDTNQNWHTFEWRFKLSSTDTANDGVFQVWFDGVEQFCPNTIGGIDQPIDQPSTTSSLITAAKPGFNHLTLMDNMATWGRDWGVAGVEGGIYINDVVISTDRIGHNYVAGNSQ